MSALAPLLEAFFTERLIGQREASRTRSPPTGTRSASCCASLSSASGGHRIS